MQAMAVTSPRASKPLPPGIDYTLSACKGQWSYMNDEGARYIFKGYRIGLTFTQCLRSMFQIHNETINVWSHLLGSLLFIALCFHVLGSPTFEGVSQPLYKIVRQSNQFQLRPKTCNASLETNESFPRNQCGSADVSSSSTAAWNASGNYSAVDYAWAQSSIHFAAAKEVLEHLKMKLPNLEKWRDVLITQASNVGKSVAAEAESLRSSLKHTASKVDKSLETIRRELSSMGAVSMEGCFICWAEMIEKLSRTRQVLLEQVEGLVHASKESETAEGSSGQAKRGLTRSEWADFTASEMLSVAATLNTGITATKQALVHASQNLQVEILQELRQLEIFPKEWDSPLERWPIIAFLMSAFSCLFLSASYHLFNCHSRYLNDILLLLDYSGISILIAGSSIPPIFYGFYCDRDLGNFYLRTVMSLSVMSFMIGMYSGLNPSSFWRVTRVLAYSANACFGLIPCWHMFLRWHDGEPMWSLCFPYMAAMLGLYAIGTVIYTYQFPEKYFPHRFDIYLSSHQLWHLLVFSAALLHFFCAVGHFHWRTLHPCTS